jgi:hypothetical protein
MISLNILKNNLVVYWSFYNSLGVVELIIIIVGLSFDLKQLETKTK